MKKALLVGINAYPSPNELQGCVNDVTNVRDILIKYFDFKSDEIRVLVDDRATYINIVERLGWLTQDAGEYEKLVFHYSGHGSQIVDRDGDELRDNMDEILCPVDFDWDSNFLADDQLARIFKGVPKGKLEVILDSCHSGTATRNMTSPPMVRIGDIEISDYRKSRSILPPVDIQCRIDEDKEYVKTRILRGVSKEEEALGHVLYAGCKDYQTCADAYIGGSYNGAFTYYFCKIIRATYDSTGSFLRRSDLISKVNRSLRYGKYGQTPQIEGSRSDKNSGIFS
jgi:hypothetical protein